MAIKNIIKLFLVTFIIFSSARFMGQFNLDSPSGRKSPLSREFNLETGEQILRNEDVSDEEILDFSCFLLRTESVDNFALINRVKTMNISGSLRKSRSLESVDLYYRDMERKQISKEMLSQAGNIYRYVRLRIKRLHLLLEKLTSDFEIAYKRKDQMIEEGSCTKYIDDGCCEINKGFEEIYAIWLYIYS